MIEINVLYKRTVRQFGHLQEYTELLLISISDRQTDRPSCSITQHSPVENEPTVKLRPHNCFKSQILKVDLENTEVCRPIHVRLQTPTNGD